MRNFNFPRFIVQVISPYYGRVHQRSVAEIQRMCESAPICFDMV